MSKLLGVLLFAPLFALGQAGSVMDPTRATEIAAMAVSAKTKVLLSKEEISKAEQQLFSDRFNRLIVAMQAFADDYNGGRGSVWPQKKADAMEKAFRDLQKTQSWKRALASTDLTARETKPADVPLETASTPSRQP